MVGCCVTVSNTVYETVIKSFTNQWASLKDRKCQTQHVVPKITGELPSCNGLMSLMTSLTRRLV
eukprot:2863138-Ditylum_brightwellii.AAC.1